MYDEYDELDELLEEAYLEGYYDSIDDIDDYYNESRAITRNVRNLMNENSRLNKRLDQLGPGVERNRLLDRQQEILNHIRSITRPAKAVPAYIDGVMPRRRENVPRYYDTINFKKYYTKH